MNYRLYRPADFTELYAIEEACFQPPLRFPRSYMHQVVTSSRTATWVAEEECVLAGFAIVKRLREGAGLIAYIETIEVAAAWRRQGIGAELLRHVERSELEAGAQSIWLHVDAENTSAIRLYEAHGYRFRGTEEHYYARSRAALIYAKPLSGTEMGAETAGQ